jgi:hypothetical protein
MKTLHTARHAPHPAAGKGRTDGHRYTREIPENTRPQKIRVPQLYEQAGKMPAWQERGMNTVGTIHRDLDGFYHPAPRAQCFWHYLPTETPCDGCGEGGFGGRAAALRQ